MEKIELSREWLERLIHIATNCPSIFSKEYLLGYIKSIESLLNKPKGNVPKER